MLTGTAWLVLSWLSGGPGGPGRLAHLGPSAWSVGLATMVEVGLGAFVVVGVGLAVRLVSPAPPVVEEPAEPDLLR